MTALAGSYQPGASGGFTFAEVLAVVTILGVLAVVAWPSQRAGDPVQAQLAAGEIAGALRFARQETLRTSTRHGVSWSQGAGQVRVFRLAATGNPPAWVYDVRHPVKRQPYTVTLAGGVTRGAALSGVAVTFAPPCAAPTGFVFDLSGQPVCGNPATSRVTGAQFTVSAGSARSSVSVAPVTGRVTQP